MNILNGSIPPGAEFSMKPLVEELFSNLESMTLPHALLKVCSLVFQKGGYPT